MRIFVPPQPRVAPCVRFSLLCTCSSGSSAQTVFTTATLSRNIPEAQPRSVYVMGEVPAAMQLSLMILGICCVYEVSSVPIINETPTNNKLDDTDELEVMEDDFTTRSLERLSSAATCLVAGIEYTHGQQINRIDPCEFCLCLDGEMFCWWQDCPPATDGPCKDQGPFSQCENVVATKNPQPPQVNSSSTTTSTKEVTPDRTPTTTVAASIFCTVLGVKYRIGDKLPHDTGNCVECICDQGAKITCSPHQCVRVDEEINDYRPPEQRLSNLDSF